MKRVDVFKKTNDDWYPAFEMGGEKLVEVSFIQLTPWLPAEERIWRVCVWVMMIAGWNATSIRMKRITRGQFF